MHLIVGETERIDDGATAVDLDQSPGDIVVLSAADSELAAFAGAFARMPEGPSLRLANWTKLQHPYSVDLYLEKTLQKAKLVIVRMMGGSGYWPYGLEALRALSRGGGPRLAVMPGEDRWDPSLEPYSTIDIAAARQLWRCCVEAGPENIGRALRLARHWVGDGEAPEAPVALPEIGFWQPGSGVVSREAALSAARQRPYAPIVFYRALIEGGSTEPIDALVEALGREGIGAVPIFVTSLKNPAVAEALGQFFVEAPPAIVLNGTAFAISRPGRSHEPTVLDAPGRPVLQIVFAGTSREAWLNSTRGLSPRDLIMNVALPEVDGRILTRPVSFKEEVARDPATDSRIVVYKADRERIAFVAAQVAAWVRLGAKPASKSRIALVLSNYPGRDGRIGNGVGLDTPESAVRIAAAMRRAGYELPAFPETGRALMEGLLEADQGPQALSPLLPQSGGGLGRGLASEPSTETLHAQHTPLSSSPPQGGRELGGVSPAILPLAAYLAFHDALPESVRAALASRWGAPEEDPLFEDGAFHVRVHRFGNIVLAVQPGRGHGVDPKATYHDPELVPPHHYLAFYAFLRHEFGADAIVQIGKHGNLEWLPGKALGLSAECWPEVALGPTPLIYPFIVNDPGEGAQAKRRSSAVIVDHLMPALTRAGAQGVFAEIETLIDEYHLAAGADPKRRDFLEAEILALAERHGIDRDLEIGRDDPNRALRAIDAHLCDIKELQIRDGLHLFGKSPEGDARIDTLLAIARAPRSGGRPQDGSLARAIANDLGLAGFDPIGCDRAADWEGPRPEVLEALGEGLWRTAGDTVERVEALARAMVAALLPLPQSEGGSGRGPTAEPSTEASHAQHTPLANSSLQGGRGQADALHRLDCLDDFSATTPILDWIVADLAPALDRSGSDEIAGVIAALDGRFIPPGPSGAPSRGRADVLPTGRNFYAVDTRAIPTEAAWRLGRLAAEALVQRYLQDEGEWPRSIAISAWGTANMRTGGDDIAQVLALIGAEPAWEPGTGRVTGFRVLTLSELKRPRVDVTLRISGMFRDAFPEQIDLIDSAIRAIAERDEDDDANPLAAARRREHHTARIFGAKPGSYGAGLQTLMDYSLWQDRAEIADNFLAASGFHYGAGIEGASAEGRLRARLAAVDAVVQNQDNREHDILDSDEYYQFQGGLAASIERLKGSAPRLYHGDHAIADSPVVRPLSEEIGRVVRGRAANPKWIAGCMRHGYKGASEMAATVDFLFGYAATTHAVGDHHFDALYDAYLGDETVRDFVADANPAALSEMSTRFAEAIDRGLWSPRRNSVHADLAEMRAGQPLLWKETA
ncbi:cobaltochelatase subunit CobN [Kaistia algarum]|uniref:cobaltochelatase subunit CobN n=1 Tax=Kaistia algarum TaxID=2083279 RepID=UPI000CE8D954|nr:cobaltochelatase subunit CobN [Kaistia algarum]MCX5514886.1 cobaltochelatase subunit CobN [Kaistia algarum]PPE79637.1 cobaltochelatase subunit CobN [Kaistia algarum]